jgi:hypothetical protein
MRVPTFLLSFSLANLAYSGIHYTMTAQSETRTDMLSAEDIMRILPGNTLLTYDETGTFWMYFPSPGTVWADRAAAMSISARGGSRTADIAGAGGDGTKANRNVGSSPAMRMTVLFGSTGGNPFREKVWSGTAM